MSTQKLLKLAHSAVAKREKTYWVHLTLRPTAEPKKALSRLSLEVSGPRMFVVGTAERADLPGPRGLLPRHLAILTAPSMRGLDVRILSLHPGRGLSATNDATKLVGSVTGIASASAYFERFFIEAQTVKGRTSESASHEQSPELSSQHEHLPLGEQLAFRDPTFLRPVGNVVSSIAGPGGGGHAIPALVTTREDAPQPGSLVLRSPDGVHRINPVPSELYRGMLIGRSRSCVLGRGFDENDGLSRIHALVAELEEGVYAFDLASRYGLRDVARPNRLIPCAQLDNGIGCLVYGAGHLVYEN